PSPYEDELIKSGVFAGENALQNRWIEKVETIIAQTSLTLPDIKSIHPLVGGRQGKHTEHLQPLLDEMSEVFKIDPTAEW
ncbi:MAG: phenylacetate-CoA oxygenase subunit PaaI, partial [Cyclobacteriaceae bacterium]|nr:phenylacetate-CoA oxygenase subunit PaaI [Cyclobacteriaceae bacterium]